MATFNVTNDSQWNTAYASAVNGDVINMRAGTYSAKTIAKQISVIGYQNTPGDIVASNGSTFSQGDSPNAGLMPLIFSSGVSGTGITVSASNATVRNFQVQGFSFGLRASNVTGVTLDNIIAINQGTQGSSGYDGFGMHIIDSSNNTITNCYVQNASAENFKISGGGSNTVRNTHSYCGNNGNPTDYYLMVTNTNNNLFEDCSAYIAAGLTHPGHGFILKWNAQNNTFRGGQVTGTSIEFNFEDVTGNLVEDVRLIGNGDYATRIWFGSGANNNKVRNVYGTNLETAVMFMDQNDGFTPSPYTDAVSLGYNNRLENLIIENALRIFEALPHLPVGGDVNAWIEDNVFDGCTFINITRYGSYYARNSGNQFIN